MLEGAQPTQVMMALWPTGDFELPADDPGEFGQRMIEQFQFFKQWHHVQAVGGPLPPELPRLVLLGERRHWVLELAPARVNLRRTPAPGDKLADVLSTFAETLLPLHTWLAEQANLRVYRMGLVADVMCKTRSSAGEKIAQYFLQPQAFRDGMPDETHVHMQRRLTLPGGLMVNRWIKVWPMRTPDPRRLDVAAMVQIDLNTMVDDTRVKTGRDLAAFLEAARDHLLEDVPILQDPDFLA